MPASRIYSGVGWRGNGHYTATSIPTRKPNIWASLGVAWRAQSLLRQSNTRQRSSSSRPCRLSQPISEIASRYQRASKGVRARGERPRGTPRGHLASAPDYRVTVPRRIRWDSSRGTRKMWRERLAFGGSFDECDTLCDAVSTRGRGSSCKMTVAMRRLLPTVAVCCWLLVSLGVGQVSTRNCYSKMRILCVSNAPPNVPETARLHTDVPSNNSAGNVAALSNSDQKANVINFGTDEIFLQKYIYI